MQEIPIEEARGVPEVSQKRRRETLLVTKRKTDANPLIKSIEPQQGEKGSSTSQTNLLPQGRGPKADLEVARVESANLERQLVDLHERLGDSEGQLRGARAQVRQMETELLDLARSKEALWEDLPKKAIEEYKESPGFEMGLVRMGRVSLEYGYQLALAQH
ncbi:hypothetical protein BHM03_00058245 [Ensete ventricosum]|nr:hypothetical protein BHM03_00058245 [Ensete ventricosum]